MKYALVVALNFVITYTGYGFFIGLMTPVLLLAMYWTARYRSPADRKWLGAAIVASLASLGSLFISYIHQSASGCDSLWSAPTIRYFWFMDLMYATTFGERSVGITGKALGFVVLLAVTAVSLYGWKQASGASGKARQIHLVALILAAYSILFCISGALGRTCLGLETALASRHINYVQLGILGLDLGSLAVARPAGRGFCRPRC